MRCRTPSAPVVTSPSHRELMPAAENKNSPKAPPLNELTKIVYHIQMKMSIDGINEIIFYILCNLRIDKCPPLVYTVVRKKTKDHHKP